MSYPTMTTFDGVNDKQSTIGVYARILGLSQGPFATSPVSQGSNTSIFQWWLYNVTYTYIYIYYTYISIYTQSVSHWVQSTYPHVGGDEHACWVVPLASGCHWLSCS